MSVLQITCDNCGAKYKLPETFQGSQAKCQKCGSVIDVARQRQQSAAGTVPAAAKPAAAARPAVDRSQAAPAAAPRPAKTAERAKAAEQPAGERSSRRSRGGDEATAERGERRGRGEAHAKKSNAMPLIASGIGLLAIVVVVVLMMRGGDKPRTDPHATAGPHAAAGGAAAAKPAPAEQPKPAAEPPKPATPPAEVPKTPAAAPSAAEPTPKPTTPAAPVERDPTKPWLTMAHPPQSMDQVADPKSYGEVVWPNSIDAAKKVEVQSLATDSRDTSARGTRAMNKLKLPENEYPALFAIVEQLRLLDYRQNEDAMTGLALNKLLEEILFEMNARYAAVDVEEAITPQKAEWNTRTVKAWLGVLSRFPDAETFKTDRAARKRKAADKEK